MLSKRVVRSRKDPYPLGENKFRIFDERTLITIGQCISWLSVWYANFIDFEDPIDICLEIVVWKFNPARWSEVLHCLENDTSISTAQRFKANNQPSSFLFPISSTLWTLIWITYDRRISVYFLSDIHIFSFFYQIHEYISYISATCRYIHTSEVTVYSFETSTIS